jgi:hypothetical protein
MLLILFLVSILVVVVTEKYHKINRQHIVTAMYEGQHCIVIYGKGSTFDLWLEHMFGENTFAPCIYLEASTRMADTDLLHLRDLPDLELVYLSGEHITDVGIRELRHLQQLTDLWLSHTAVTDDGISCLRDLSQLRNLALTSPIITDGGIQDLQKVCPQLAIIRSP